MMTKEQRCEFNTRLLYSQANKKYSKLSWPYEAHQLLQDNVDLFLAEIKKQKMDIEAKKTKAQKDKLRNKLFGLIGVAQKSLIDLDLVEEIK